MEIFALSIIALALIALIIITMIVHDVRVARAIEALKPDNPEKW